MIKIMDDFKNMNLLTSLSESQMFKCNQMNIDEIYSKGKELAVNLNDEITKLLSNQVFIDTKDNPKMIVRLSKFEYELPKQINITTPPSIMGISVSMSVDEIKEKLISIPDLILTLIGMAYDYVKKNSTDLNIGNVIENTYLYVLHYTSAANTYMNALRERCGIINEEASNIENVDSYVNELRKIINDIREYYDNNDYTKILTPRKKQIDKMEEYVKGALERRYTLRIPLYKVEDVNKNTRDVIENKFIKDVKKIVDNYDNYALLSPNWDEDEDIFIYLTLKEPFGEKGDKDDRKKIKLANVDMSKDKMDSSLTEAALTGKERKELKDSEFGLPKLRKYPLNDETRIRSAIKMFKWCKPKFRSELANNIAKAVKAKNLVGKVYVNEKYKEYFPKFMIQVKTIREAVELQSSLKEESYDSVFDNDNRLY